MTGPGPQQNWPSPPPWPPAPGPAYRPAPARSSRDALIIAAAIISVALIVAGFLIAKRDSGGSAPAETAASSTSSTTSTPALVQVVPATLLPTSDQIRQATLIDVKFIGEVITKVGADATLTPLQCALADSPISLSAWGTAISTARQRFGDGVDYDHSINFGLVAAAVFDTPEAAADSFGKVSDAVKGCSSFTGGDAGSPSALSWAVTDVATQDGRLTWTNARTGASRQWKCSYSYRVQVNAVAYGFVCATNPGAGPSQLTDQIVANGTKK